MASMESGGTSAVAHHRSEMNEFEFTTAAELEAHINMNASVARANFDKYYEDRLVVVAQTWKDTKRRLDVTTPFDVPMLIIDVSPAKFDFSTIATLFDEKIKEREAKKAQHEQEKAVGDHSSDLFIDHRVSQDAPLKLKITGVDYTNIEKVVDVVKNMPVRRLEMSNNSLDHDDAEAIGTLLAATKSIQAIDLSGNKIGTEGLATLVESLKASTSITDLDLGANEIGRRGGKSLSEVLAHPSCKLERLQLAANNLGIYGTEELVPGLKANKSLKSLGLQTNTIGDDGLRKLLVLFEDPDPNTSLLQIALESNKITDDALEAQVKDHCVKNENIQQLGFLEDAETSDRSNREAEVDREWQLLQLLFEKATKQLKEKAEAAKPTPKPAPAAKSSSAKAPPAKAPAKAAAKSKAPVTSPKKCLSKSPERTAVKKTPSAKPSAQAPAPSSAVAKAAGGKKSVARSPSPKKAAPRPKK